MAYSRIHAIIKQDLTAYIEALKDDKPNLANIYANRVVSNYVFADSSENSILGFILKEQANILSSLQRSRPSSLYNEAREGILDQLEQLMDHYSKTIHPNDLWQYYTQCVRILHKYQLDEPEVNAYNEMDPEFTRFVIDKLISYLSENCALVETSHIFDGTLAEIVRLINTHGFNDRDLMIYLYMTTILRVLDYKKFELDRYDLKGNVNSWIEEKIKNIEMINTSDVEVIEMFNRILPDIASLGSEWRYYYIKYREIFREYALKKPTRVLSDDEKEALINTFASAIEKEMK